MARQAPSTARPRRNGPSFASQVAELAAQMGLPPGLTIPAALEEMEEGMGIEASGSWPERFARQAQPAGRRRDAGAGEHEVAEPMCFLPTVRV